MNSEIVMYQTEDGLTKIETTFDNDTVWLSIEETWSKRSIEKILENEKYTGMVTLLDPLHRNLNIR